MPFPPPRLTRRDPFPSFASFCVGMMKILYYSTFADHTTGYHSTPDHAYLFLPLVILALHAPVVASLHMRPSAFPSLATAMTVFSAASIWISTALPFPLAVTDLLLLIFAVSRLPLTLSDSQPSKMPR
jgi:hypothetical protein